MNKHIKLENGVKVPNLAFGLGRMNATDNVYETLKCAIECGFRHIDTSSGYASFETGFSAIKQIFDNKIINREELFLTQKIDPKNMGYDKTIKIIDKTLELASTNYLDMTLIHNPYDYDIDWKRYVIDTWRALENLYKQGKIKAIGISNFNIEHIALFLNYAKIMPMINQIELHPNYQQKKLVELCKNNNIALEAWSPLMYAVNSDLIKEMGQKYNKTAAQIALRWSIQKGYIPICSSNFPEQIKENINIYDFELSQEDMLYIDSMDGGMYSTDNKRRVIKVETDSQELIDHQFYHIRPYKQYYKLFGFIPFLKFVNYKWNKQELLLFNKIPLLKITKRELE